MSLACYLAVTPWQWHTAPLASLLAWSAIVFIAPHAYLRLPPKGAVYKGAVSVIIKIDGTGDMVALRDLLQSIDQQSRVPHAVYLTTQNCQEAIQKNIEAIFSSWALTTPVVRTAHLRSVLAILEAEQVATVFALVENGAVLDRHALEEGCKPFCGKRVHVVTPLHVGSNRHTGMLERLQETSCLAAQVAEHAAMARFGAAPAQHAQFVLCRGWILAQATLNPLTSVSSTQIAQIMSRTQYGRCALAETSIVFVKRQTRFMRAIGLRSCWWRALWVDSARLVRDYPVKTGAWWLGLAQISSITLYTLMFLLLAASSTVQKQVPWETIGFLLALGYIRTIRITALALPGNEPLKKRLACYVMLLPLTMLLDVYRTLRLPGRNVFTAPVLRPRGRIGVNIDQS
jgi:hypothetical protein